MFQGLTQVTLQLSLSCRTDFGRNQLEVWDRCGADGLDQMIATHLMSILQAQEWALT